MGVNLDLDHMTYNHKRFVLIILAVVKGKQYMAAVVNALLKLWMRMLTSLYLYINLYTFTFTYTHVYDHIPLNISY